MSESTNPIVEMMRDMGKCVITITAENKEGIATIIMPSARFDNYISVVRKNGEDEGETVTGDVQAMQYLFRVSEDQEGNIVYALPFARHEDAPKIADFEVIDMRDETPEAPATDDVPMTKVVDERDDHCKQVWPECYSGDYNPACCRFPKSCSAGVTRIVPVEENDGS